MFLKWVFKLFQMVLLSYSYDSAEKKVHFSYFRVSKNCTFSKFGKKKFDLIFSNFFLNYHSENKVRMIDSFGFRKARDHPTYLSSA